MEITITEAILGLLISAATGALGSLIAPWANWGVEKRKKKLEWRNGFMQDCKRAIGKNDFDLDIFRKSSLYSNLKPLLNDKLKKEIENKREKHIPLKPHRELKEELAIIGEEEKIKARLLDEIAIIEKKWGLL